MSTVRTLSDPLNPPTAYTRPPRTHSPTIQHNTVYYFTERRKNNSAAIDWYYLPALQRRVGSSETWYHLSSLKS